MAETESKRKIMVAVDKSEESMNALCWALDFFCIGNAKEKDSLILLHAQPPPGDYSNMDSADYIFSSEIDKAVEKYLENVTENVLKRAKGICIGKNVGYILVCEESRVGVGDARDVICEEAEKVKPDFLVIGSHGYGTIKRALLGSVSDYCAHNVKCPVLIVKHLKK